MAPQFNKLTYKPDTQSSEEFVMIVHPETKWKDGGNQGKLGQASNQQLENVFGTSREDDVAQFMLERGTLLGKTDMQGRLMDKQRVMPVRVPSVRGSVPPQPSRADSPAVDDEAEEAPFFDLVDELQQHGINVQDITKLKDVFQATAAENQETLLHTTYVLCEGLSEAKVDKIKDAVQKTLGSSFATGLEVQDKRHTVRYISTGSKAVDVILGGRFLGGFQTQSISEGQSALAMRNVGLHMYGEFRTGKTQLAHTMSVIAQLPLDMGGAEGKHELLEELSSRFAQERFKLLIVDSIMALFRTDFSGRGELSERQQKLAQHLQRLSRMAEEYNVAVLLTNQVQSDPGATLSFAPGGAMKPIGGHILSHASTTRMALRKGRAEERVAKLVDSPDRPESEASYKLDDGGWSDL
ncbi:hypothetical protein Clacol_001419 [Clathrus columnatus]|uniref:Uncharacterized protein n=1 Tax=Clathrus columnatus TaxID=1419009 RepID=A0AAV5A1Q0_9AGAM|nr:hypothetical protein Clacol_001419 [Clathrus columnatus]